MSFYPLQTGFAGGLVSPRLLGNTDAAIYGKSLLECTNWEILPQGSIKLRGGMKHLATGVDKAARLLPFPRHNEEDLIVELRDGRMRVLDKQGRFYAITEEGSEPAGVVGPDSEYLINSGGVWSSSSITNARQLLGAPFNLHQCSRRGTVQNGRIRYTMTCDRKYVGYNQNVDGSEKDKSSFYLQAETEMRVKVPMATLAANSAYTVNILLNAVPWGQTHFDDTTQTTNGDTNRNFHEIVEVVSSDGDVAFRQVKNFCDLGWLTKNGVPLIVGGQPKLPLMVEDLVSGELVRCELAEDRRRVRTSFTVFEDVVTGVEIQDVETKDWFLQYRVGPIKIDTRLYGNALPCSASNNPNCFDTTFSYAEASYELTELSVEGPAKSGTDNDGTIDHPFTNIAVRELQWAITSKENLMVLVHGSTPPYQLRVDNDNYIYFGPVTFDADVPPSGASAPGEYPRTATFHLGRLWFGGNNLYPSRLWASRVGNFGDFAVDASTQDNDPLLFDLDIKGQINWLFSQQYLFIGTDREEVKGSGQGNLITATNFKFDVQSMWGSAYEMPSACGPGFAVLARNRRNAFIYNESELLQTGWKAKNLMYHVEHLVDADIVRVVYTESVNPKLYILLANSKLIVASFDERVPVEAYYVIETNALVNDIAVCHSVFGDFVTVATSRNQNEHIEVLDDLEECYLDGWIKTDVMSEASDGGAYDNDFSTDYDVNGKPRKYIENVQDYANERYEVQILGVKDGIYDLYSHPTAEFDGNGRAYLEYWADGVAFVGTSYQNTVKTLPLASGLKGGSALGANKIFSNPVLRMGVGDGEPIVNGKQSKLLLNGDIKECETYLDRNETAILTITQVEPKATEIIAVYGKASSEAK